MLLAFNNPVHFPDQFLIIALVSQSFPHLSPAVQRSFSCPAPQNFLPFPFKTRKISIKLSHLLFFLLREGEKPGMIGVRIQQGGDADGRAFAGRQYRGLPEEGRNDPGGPGPGPLRVRTGRFPLGTGRNAGLRHAAKDRRCAWDLPGHALWPQPDPADPAGDTSDAGTEAHARRQADPAGHAIGLAHDEGHCRLQRGTRQLLLPGHDRQRGPGPPGSRESGHGTREQLLLLQRRAAAVLRRQGFSVCSADAGAGVRLRLYYEK